MKKIRKKLLSFFVLIFLACLCTGTTVFAETISGEIKTSNGSAIIFSWKFDTETKTLTVEKVADIRTNADGEAWKPYQNEIEHVIIKNCGFLAKGIGNPKDITMLSDDGFSWTIDVASRTVMLNGEGDFRLTDIQWPSSYKSYYDTIIIADEIGLLARHSSMGGNGYGPTGNVLVLGKNTRFATGEEAIDLWPICQEFKVNSDNPYYAVYDGALYTKDYQTLLACPRNKTTIQFPKEVKIIGKSAFFNSAVQELIIPWGVTTVERGQLPKKSENSQNPTKIVFPDTITDYQNGNFVSRENGVYLNIYYSRHNQALTQGLAVSKDEYNWHPTLYPLDSMAEFYPGHTSEPSEPEESRLEPSQPSQSSTPASEPSKPVDSPSKPADTSKPAQIASKPASQSQVESSVEQEKPSSAPAQSTIETESFLQEESMLESSTPEISEQEDSLESSEESLESSEEPSDESSLLEAPGQASGGVSWAIPLICAMGAVAIVAAVILPILWKRK